MIRRILKTQFFGFLVSKWPTEVLKTMFQLKVKRAGTKRRHPKTATATVVAHSHGFHPRLKDWSKKKGSMCFELAFYQEKVVWTKPRYFKVVAEVHGLHSTAPRLVRLVQKGGVMCVEFL